MSDFKVGDKVYLECEVFNKDMSDNAYILKYKNWYGSKDGTNYVKDDVLHPTDEPYNKGLRDAWELARKIVLPTGKGGYTVEEIDNIFGKRTYISVMETFTPQEALTKVKAYEDEIKVGDVVTMRGEVVESIVTKVDGYIIFRLFKDGSCYCGTNKENLRKTGRHFDSIDEFMRSEDD